MQQHFRNDETPGGPNAVEIEHAVESKLALKVSLPKCLSISVLMQSMYGLTWTAGCRYGS